MTHTEIVRKSNLAPRTVRYAVKKLKENHLIIEKFNFRDARQIISEPPGNRMKDAECSILLCEIMVRKYLPVMKAEIVLRHVRHEGVSQSDAARRLGVTRAAVSRYLRSKKDSKAGLPHELEHISIGGNYHWQVQIRRSHSAISAGVQ